ncbi:MAG: hypothetical protein GC191_04210 [Azospirillum sp.]|nr:hypothetical protein [Azospirillum sp.]
MIVSAAGGCFALPRAVVRAVAFPAPVSPLPLQRAPTDGLVEVAGRPMTQIDATLLVPGGGREKAAQEPAGRAGKLVVIAGPQGRGEVALRVDAVLGWAKPAQAPTPFPLAAVFALLAEEPAEISAVAPETSDPDPVVDLLLVDQPGRRLALPVDGIEAAARIDAVSTLAGHGAAAVTVATIDGRLIPLVAAAASPEPRPSGWAVLGDCGGGEGAFAVSRVVGLHRLPRSAVIHLFRPGGDADAPATVCFLAEGGVPVVIESFAQAVGGTGNPGFDCPAPISAGRQRGSEDTVSGAGGGLLIETGGVAAVVPLACLGRVLDPDEVPAGALQARRRRAALPVLGGDRHRRQAGQAPGSPACRTLVELGGPDAWHVLLAADRLRPEPTGRRWQSPPWLPRAAAAVVEAVRPDDSGEGWLVRLRGDFDFPALPFSVRRLVVSSVLGWVNLRLPASRVS